ncbi:MAG: hypothetical protein ACYCVL_07165 [Gemmatimonadaceae bacterium]
MSSLTTSSVLPSSLAAVPPIHVINTIPLRAQAEDHLHVLATHTLPALARQRAFLIRTWGLDSEHGAPVFVTEHEVVWVHPAGLDRVATAMAHEQATVREIDALRELLTAFRRYDLGGSVTANEVGDEAEAPQEPAPDFTTGGDTNVVSDVPNAPEYEAWMRAHTTAVHMELWIARKDRDAERVRDLTVECRELDRRLRQLTGRPWGRTRVASRSA